ncbi:hypothetical protein Hdeb2414_s0015g00449051 [Helianthus debilis subsp. tardiflorus]
MRTKVRVIIFTNDGLNPTTWSKDPIRIHLPEHLSLQDAYGGYGIVSRRLEATWSAWRAKQFAIKCQTTRSCTELASFMDGVWKSSRPIWRVFYMRAIRRLKA